MQTLNSLFAVHNPNETNWFGKPFTNLWRTKTPMNDIAFSDIQLDSRQVKKNDLFILLTSQTSSIDSSASYAYQVIDKAAFIISEIKVSQLVAANPELSPYQDKIYYQPDIRLYLGNLIYLSQQHQQPAHLQNIVAVTGTNGKTTVSQLTAQLADSAGKPSAVMGTAGNGKLGQLIQASHTTGDVLAVQTFVHHMASQAVDTLALEASSHGLDQHRLQGLPINIAVYTNLSRDHLDYHSDMADYARAKSILFDRHYFPTLTHAIINLDDEYANTMLEQANNSGIKHVWTYTLDKTKEATFKVENIIPSLLGSEIELTTEFGSISLNSPLLGLFNVANLIASVAAAYAIGIQLADMPKLVAQLKGADGRMDRVNSTTGCFIVDYAHTPDALIKVLTSLKAHCDGELWAVFGCGGDRDKGKRPLMTQAGLSHADKLILTADNPRSEEVDAILTDMQVGMTEEQHARTYVEPNRKDAIHYAVKHANKDDIVVIAGKGHETYQEIKGIRYDFDDRKVLSELL